MRILVVEDDFLIAEQLAFEIRQLGDEVIGPFSNIDGAINSLGMAEAAILDVRLREGTSFPVADRLAATHTPFLFLTGYDPTVVPERFVGARLYNKPSPTRTLLADLHVQRSRPAPEPTLEATVIEMMLRARRQIPDRGAAERLVETVLLYAVAQTEAGRSVTDMHDWLLSRLDQELALRHRTHMH